MVEWCRICGSSALDRVLDLGKTPLANSLVEPRRAAEVELRFPLQVVRCLGCGLVQLGQVVAPEVMFRSYPYSSSASAPLVGHFAGLAQHLADRYTHAGSLVVELGSNDGVLLGPLSRLGRRVVGVEPATNIAEVANRAGLETWNEFFSPDAARRIAAARGAADVVVGTNVFAHIDDLRSVLEGVDALLSETGVFVAEVPYLGDLLAQVEYDTVYHEHLSYFSLAPLTVLFENAGMEIVDIASLSIHGGSIRFAAARKGRRRVSPDVPAFRSRERSAGLDDAATYASFAHAVERSRDELLTLLGSLRQQGKRIAGHGASAKGGTLLNYCGIGTDTLDFIADSTPFKQGMLSPGMHIPVRPEDAIAQERPDYLLLLAWNYADTIVAHFADYASAGGRFIHPIPLARVLPAA